MKKLTYPLTAAFAIAICAVLVACGGGGGGGGTPATAVPVATPTATPIAALTVVATPAASTTGTTLVNLGGVSNGTSNVISSASVTLPAVNVASTATIVLSASAPTGVAVPSARNLRGRFTLGGVPNTPLAYFSLTMTNTVQITSSPAFTVVLPTNVSVTAGNAYLVVTTSGTAGSWQQVAGPITAANTMTFPSGPLSPSPFTLTAGTAYTFAIVTTGSLTIGPQPTPTLMPTTSADGWSPSDVANTFQFPVQSGYNGTGQTVVILGDEVPSTADVNAYLAYFGITSAGAGFTTVPINGGPATGDSGGLLEATLDVETVAGLAPGANIEFYALGDLTGTSFTDAYTALASDTKATVMNVSFGGCEYPGSKTAEDPPLAQAAGNGVLMFASAGDQGNECFGPDQTGPSPAPSYAPGANFPASDPNVIGVGGNENSTGSCGVGSLTSTVAWNDMCFGQPAGQGASGGGISSIFTLPSYQTGLVGASSISTTMRNVPDIAMPSEGVAAYVSGKFETVSGTSWSAPEAAAMAAEINEYCGGSLVTPTKSSPVARFYTAYARSHANFLDILTGNNSFAGSSPSYTASAGYDNVTGLGIPYGMMVASSLCPSNAPSLRPRASVTHSIAAAPIDAYGEARDTSLGWVPHMGTDMGERGSEPIKVVVVMRATTTLVTDEASVIATLTASGFTVTHAYGNHMAIDATAPATTAQRFFQTSIHNIDQGPYGGRYANVSPVVLPASIARVTQGALVDNLVIARWFHHRIVPLGKR